MRAVAALCIFSGLFAAASPSPQDVLPQNSLTHFCIVTGWDRCVHYPRLLWLQSAGLWPCSFAPGSNLNPAHSYNATLASYSTLLGQKTPAVGRQDLACCTPIPAQVTPHSACVVNTCKSWFVDLHETLWSSCACTPVKSDAALLCPALRNRWRSQ